MNTTTLNVEGNSFFFVLNYAIKFNCTKKRKNRNVKNLIFSNLKSIMLLKKSAFISFKRIKCHSTCKFSTTRKISYKNFKLQYHMINLKSIFILTI